jgi:tetratricopeptide (TPR) repeat protein
MNDKPISKISLYLRLIWHRIVFWSFPTPEEDYYLNLGTTYFYLEKYYKAISLLEKSEKSHNHQDSSYSRYNFFYLGYCYLNVGNFVKAVKYFEKYLRFNNNDLAVLADIGWCYMLINRPSDALETYLRGAKMETNSPIWHIECAQILMELNRADEALQHLELAEAKMRDSNVLEIIKSLKYKIEGRLDESIEALKSVISKIHPNGLSLIPKLDCYIMLSRYQREYRDIRGVLSTVEKVLEDNPTDLWVINEVAIEYADQGIKIEKTLKLINKALKFQPENSIFIDTKGWILYKMGKKEEAKLEINKSLALNPDCKDTQEHYKLIMA